MNNYYDGMGGMKCLTMLRITSVSCVCLVLISVLNGCTPA